MLEELQIDGVDTSFIVVIKHFLVFNCVLLWNQNCLLSGEIGSWQWHDGVSFRCDREGIDQQG